MILSASACAIWGGASLHESGSTCFRPACLLPALPTHESPTHDSIGFCPSLTLRDPAPPQPTFVPTVGVFVERLGVPEQWGGRPGGQPQSLCFYHRSATDCNTLLSPTRLDRAHSSHIEYSAGTGSCRRRREAGAGASSGAQCEVLGRGLGRCCAPPGRRPPPLCCHTM